MNWLLLWWWFFLLICHWSLADVGYFWYTTDIHLDLKYDIGTDANCGGYLDIRSMPRQCCRAATNYSDRHEPFVPAGEFGEPYHRCDLPMWTFDAILEGMVKIQPKPTAIFFTGDVVGHDLPLQTMDSNIEIIKYAVAKFKERFPTTRTLFSMGNHDAWPTNMLAHQPLSDWLFTPLSYEFFLNDWLSLDESIFFAENGYFSTTLDSGRIRVISLETQWVSELNIFIERWSQEKTHPMVSWFQSQLAEARASQQKVILLGHIPPDAGTDCFEAWSEAFVSLVRNYTDVFLLQLFGHTHKDRFGLIHEENGIDIAGWYLVGGAVTPYDKQFPNVKLISYDTETFELIDIVTYFWNITRANEAGVVVMEKEYSMRDFYRLSGEKGVLLSDLKAVAERLSQDDGYFTEFVKYYFGSSKGAEKCQSGSFCRTKLLCDINWLSPEFRVKQKCV